MLRNRLQGEISFIGISKGIFLDCSIERIYTRLRLYFPPWRNAAEALLLIEFS
jgi:hypothetical protein